MDKIRQNIKSDLNTKLFAVAGRPILHSLSPHIWNYSFDKLNIDARYFRLTGSSAKQIITMIKEIGLPGCNITSPFKEEIIQYLDEIDPDAKKISAVNCVKNENGKLVGYNTDIEGFYLALKANAFDPKSKKCMVLGAGGAAKAVIFSLLKHGAKDVLILNRTFDKAEKLAIQLGVRTLDINEKEVFKKTLADEIKNTDLIVSCLPSLEAEIIDKDLLHSDITVFDANYSGISKLKKGAIERGCKIIEGTDWLVHQAAIFFKDIFNEDPIESMQEAVTKIKSNKNNKSKNISIIGFMGSGKTRMAKELSEKLGMKLLDLDYLIEESEGKTIKEIFANKGENYFRGLETKLLNSALHKNSLADKPFVLACGGGIVTSEENIKILKDNSTVIWRFASLDTIKERLQRPKHADKRPLSKDIDKLWDLRKTLYAKTSDLCLMDIADLEIL